MQCSQHLSRATIIEADFDEILSQVQESDCVFLDPPYTVKHNDNHFRRYNQRIFSWDDQTRLATVTNALAQKGNPVVLTNAFHRDILELYSGRHFLAFALTRTTNMAGLSDKRGICQELILISKGMGYDFVQTRKLLAEYLPGRARKVVIKS